MRSIIRNFGNSIILRSRLWKKEQDFSMSTASNSSEFTASSSPVPQKLEHLLILDFEATCDRFRNPTPQEIIEFPCLKLNTCTWSVESQFHQYVRPVAHPTLSSFCTELTGIVQDMVDAQPTLEETLNSFDAWLRSEGLLNEDGTAKDWAFVTCGDWDLKTMLRQQCDHFGYARRDYFRRWINAKKAYFRLTKKYPKGMMQMLESLNLQHEGKHHSGIDDSKNIAQIVKALGLRGILFEITGVEQ